MGTLRAKYHVGVSGMRASLCDFGDPKGLPLIAVRVDDREQLLSAVGALTSVAGDLLHQDRAGRGKVHEIAFLKEAFLDGLREMNRLQDERAAKQRAEEEKRQREYERLAKRRGRVANALAEFEGLPADQTVALVPNKRRKRGKQ